MNIEDPVAPVEPTTPVESTTVESTPEAPETPAPVAEKPKKFGNIFTSSNPSQIPNKFFNFLEDEAVNMATEEPVNTPNVTNEQPIPAPIEPVASVEPTIPAAESQEEIEMLDFLTPEAPKSSYVDEIKTKINDLNLDLSKVTITDEDTLTEHIIKINIKKDQD